MLGHKSLVKDLGGGLSKENNAITSSFRMTGFSVEWTQMGAKLEAGRPLERPLQVRENDGSD